MILIDIFLLTLLSRQKRATTNSPSSIKKEAEAVQEFQAEVTAINKQDDKTKKAAQK